MRNYKPTWLRLRIILTGIWPKVLAPPTANGGAQVTPARGYDLAKIGGTLKTGENKMEKTASKLKWNFGSDDDVCICEVLNAATNEYCYVCPTEINWDAEPDDERVI